MKNLLSTLLFIIFCTSILLLSIRGYAGNPTRTEINSQEWKDNGPFELSPERGRYALMFSIIEDNSFSFSLPIARFATPDLGYIDGKYVSLFAPGISFLIIPGYILGKSLGFAQVGTFAVISIFALLNIILLRSIAIRIGAHPFAATLGSMVFIFASPAFAYAVSLFQHHVSTFLILLSIYTLLRFKNIWSLALIWFLIVASVSVDYPNLILMLPIGLYALGRIIVLQQQKQSLNVKIKLVGFLTFISAVLPLTFFLWFNHSSYGNPFQLAGTVASVKVIDEQGKPAAPQSAEQEHAEVFLDPEKQKKSAIGFFRTRELLNGFYMHLFSPDRGTLMYTPVILLGIFGMFALFKKNSKILSLFLAIIGINLLFYAMFGFGGWAFGSRYLVPSYALMAIFIAIALTHFRRNILFVLFFLSIMFYSVWVNALGAITTSRNPPKVEVAALEAVSGIEEKYTYARNFDYLLENRSKSLVFQTFAKNYISAWQYHILITGLIMGVSGIYMILLVLSGRGQHD